MKKALQTPFEVLNAAGDIVGTVLVGGESVHLPAGTYKLRRQGDSAPGEEVLVKPEEETRVVF